jgi:hypothetical protein
MLEHRRWFSHAAVMPQALPISSASHPVMTTPELTALLDAVSQPLADEPLARDWLTSELTEQLAALPPPPTGALTGLAQRLLDHWQKRRSRWLVVAVAIAVVAISGGHFLLTNPVPATTANSSWVLASLSGKPRLAAAVLLDWKHAETNAKECVMAAPNDLAARELWLMLAPDGDEEMRKFVAECERLDPGNGIYQLRYSLWNYSRNFWSQTDHRIRHKVANEALATILLGLQAERIQSHIGGLMREVATAVEGPHDYSRARKVAALVSTERPHHPVRSNGTDLYSLYAGISLFHRSPFFPWPGGGLSLSEVVEANRIFYEKSAPFLADGALVQRPFSGSWWMIDTWGTMLYDTKHEPPLSEVEIRRFMDACPPSFPLDSSGSNRPLVGLGDNPYELADLRKLGLTERMFEPLIQMQWAASDRKYAWYGAAGLLLCAFGLQRLSLAHFRPPGRVANGVQGLIPPGDAWLGAAIAVGLTVGCLAVVMAVFPTARQLPLRIEPDMYFYAPTAALLLCAVFASAATAVRMRCRALRWSGPHLLLVWLPVVIAIASIAVQFYFKTTDQKDSSWSFRCWGIGPLGLQAAINLATAVLGGMWLVIGLLTWRFGSRRKFLERALLLRTTARFLLVASILMGGVGGWCRVRELVWGTRDALFNTGPGQLEILRLHDDLKAHWHAADTAIFNKPISEFEKHPPNRR